MWITAEQFCFLLQELVKRNRWSPFRLDDPRVLAELFMRQYRITGIYPPPSIDQIRREYLPPEWMTHDPANPSRYVMETPQTTIAPASPEAVGLINQRRRAALQFTPGPEPEIPDIEAEFALLRDSPVAALTYVNLLAQGVDSRDAMDRAYVAGHVFELIQMTPGGMRATGEALLGPATPSLERKPFFPPPSPREVRQRLLDLSRPPARRR